MVALMLEDRVIGIRDVELALNPFTTRQEKIPDRIIYPITENKEIRIMYEKIIKAHDEGNNYLNYDRFKACFNRDYRPILLNPYQIDALVQQIIESHPKYAKELMFTWIIRDMIDKAKEHGYDDFTLHTGDMIIDEVGMNLNDSAVTLYGNAGHSLGACSKNSKFIVHGMITMCGFALNSENCLYTFDTINIGYEDFVIFRSNPKHCIFTSRDGACLDKLKERLERKDYHNRNNNSFVVLP